MKLLRAKIVVAALALVMTAQSASPASADGPSSLKNTDVGTAEMTLNTSERFDGIWMGRDGDRGGVRADGQPRDGRCPPRCAEGTSRDSKGLPSIRRSGAFSDSWWGCGSAFLVGAAARAGDDARLSQ